MKIRYLAMFLVATILISSVAFFGITDAEALSFPSLGSITSCTVDNNRNLVVIKGSVKHSVLIGNRTSKIALYRFDPWCDVASDIATAEPIAVTDMSIAFVFEVPCSTILQKTSLYAVALISPEDKVSLISAPTYVDAVTGNTSNAGFKAILTSDNAAALPSLPGSAIVDVYLDRLNNGNNSGYIYNADGDLFYFDKTVISEVDRIVRSYSAAGTDVYLRFLISSSMTNLSFCANAATWATNKCIVIDDEESLKAVYAYTSFLASRYNGGNYGKAKGIILGCGADVPILNNYALLVSDDYNTVYARSLAVVGMAAAAAGNTGISLIVPISDTLTAAGKVNAEEFLYDIGDYLDTYSNITFTVLCESRHNPYKITDDMFVTEIVDDTEYTENFDTDPAFGNDLTPPEETIGYEESTDYVTEKTTAYESLSEQVAEEITDVVEGTDAYIETESATDTEVAYEQTSAPDILVKNTNADGYYCTDNLEVFTKMFERLKKAHSSVNKGFAWCWYPDDYTDESALGVCYSYNYMKLASVGADFYAIGLEKNLVNRFPSMAHLFKYIDTIENVKETSYARKAFGIESWSDIIDKYKTDTGVFSALNLRELQPNIQDFTGEVKYLDYSSGKGAVEWYSGYYCQSLSLQNSDGDGFLKASFDPATSGFAYAEIGYVLDDPEPLLVGDALTFDLMCGEEDGSLYEITVYVNYGGGTLESHNVVAGGVRSALSALVDEFDSTTLVNSIRISVSRVTGEGPFELKLYGVTLNDYVDSSEMLERKIKDVRAFLRVDSSAVNEANKVSVILSVAVLVFVGVIFVLFAYASDKKEIIKSERPIRRFK